MPHHSFGLCSLPLAFALLAALPGAQAQSLVELYESARAYDASYLSARQQFEANLARAEQAKAGILPKAALTSGANLNQFDTSASSALSRSFPNLSGGLSASKPLYNPAAQGAYDQAIKQVEVAKAQLETAEQDLIVRTSQAYFDVLSAQDSLASVRAQRAAVEEQLAAAKRRFEVGTSTIVDTRQAQATFDRIVAAQIQAENDLTVRRIALDQLVGKNQTQPLPLKAPVALPPLEQGVQTWVQQAETVHPSVRAAQNNLEIARLEVARAEAGQKPTVDLVANYNYGRNPKGSLASTLASTTHSAAVGVSLNLPLFTGYSVQNRIRETLALSDKAQTDLEGARRSAAQATRQVFFGLLSGQSRVRALEAAELSTQSLVDSTRLGYQVGVTINLDVLDAQSQLFQTRRDLAVARYEVLVGNLRLRQASGVLAPQDLQPINNLLARP
jgi:outer membrane protein